MFLEELGLKESGLEKLIRASYHLLGLISYLTAGEPEVRAWTIKRGTKAPQAAGKIHTDFERGLSVQKPSPTTNSSSAAEIWRQQGKRTGALGRKGLCGAGRGCDAFPV